jgi:hypothetical protein
MCPWTLRPPVFFIGASNRFCGLDVVSSAKSAVTWNRIVGV